MPADFPSRYPSWNSWLRPVGGAVLCLLLSGSVYAWPGKGGHQKNTKATASQSAQTDPLKRPLTEKQRKKQDKKLRNELQASYKHWLDEDVAYIITPQEREAFLHLHTNEERDQFIEQFWARRNPNPDSPYNSYKEEIYRRIAYANEHFAAGIPGWKTDRGRMYITFGPPDEIDSHPSGGTWQRPMWMGGGETSTYPWEDWRYRYIPGIGQEVIMEFVDTCMCGDYHLTMDPSEKDALTYVPGAGLTELESMGMASKTDRFTRADGTHMPTGYGMPANMDEFSRLERYAEEMRPPKIKFKDLEEVVNHNINYNLLPFQVRTDFIKITDDTVLVPFTVQIADRNMTFKEDNHVQQSKINVFGRLSTMTGRTVDTFENVVSLSVPAELLPQYMHQSSRYWHGALLKPGLYRLDMVLKDVNSPNKMGTLREAIRVPAYQSGELASSTIMLADEIQKVPTKDVGAGQFIVGDTKVRPVVGSRFHQNQSMGIWMQVYNLKIDSKTHKPSATIDWQITNLANNQTVLDHKEAASQISNAAEQMTLEKTLPLAALKPGAYRLTVKVTDNLAGHSISPQSTFTVVR